MKKIFLSIIALCFFPALVAHAGSSGGSSGGPPAKTDEPGFGQAIVVDAGVDANKIEISPEDMRKAIDAALGDKTVPIDFGKGALVTLKPDNFDFKSKVLEGKVLEDGSRIRLQQIQEMEVQN